MTLLHVQQRTNIIVPWEYAYFTDIVTVTLQITLYVIPGQTHDDVCTFTLVQCEVW